MSPTTTSTIYNQKLITINLRFVLLILVLVVLSISSHACHFPRFLLQQPDDLGGPGHPQQQPRRWYHHVTYQEGGTGPGIESADVATFAGRHMSVEKYTDKFANKSVTTQQQLYRQFLKRSSTVVQMRSSFIALYQDPQLCSEHNLRLDDWPLVSLDDVIATGTSALAADGAYSHCPLPPAGYDVTLYDRKYRRGICNVHDGEVRLEVGCDADDDDDVMTMRFRWPKCVPPQLGMTSLDTRLKCLASWADDDSNVFSIVVEWGSRAGDLGERPRRAWCLRHSTRGGLNANHRTFYLYRRLHCDPFPIRNTDNDVVVVDVRSPLPVPVSTGLNDSFCRDDYDGCRWRTDGHMSSSSAAATCPKTDCARTCRLCSSDGTWPTGCRFPVEIRGRWRHFRSDAVVEIGDGFIELSGRARWECVSWGSVDTAAAAAAAAAAASTAANRFMLASNHLAEKQCRPRIACVEFDPAFFSSPATRVLTFRRSVTEPWPAVSSLSCSSFRFAPSASSREFLVRDDIVPLEGATAVADSNNNNNNCGLRQRLTRFASVAGWVDARGQSVRFSLNSDTTFDVVRQVGNRSATSRYRCLYVDQRNASLLVLAEAEVTSSSSSLSASGLSCWLFADDSGNSTSARWRLTPSDYKYNGSHSTSGLMFYSVHASDCDLATLTNDGRAISSSSSSPYYRPYVPAVSSAAGEEEKLQTKTTSTVPVIVSLTTSGNNDPFLFHSLGGATPSAQLTRTDDGITITTTAGSRPEMKTSGTPRHVDGSEATGSRSAMPSNATGRPTHEQDDQPRLGEQQLFYSNRENTIHKNDGAPAAVYCDQHRFSIVVSIFLITILLF